jgi:hypothetical protein
MNDILYTGKCPVCDMGRMELLYDISEEHCFAMCEECDIEFNDPDSLISNVGGKRVYFKDIESVPKIRAATAEEASRDGFTVTEN